MKSLSFINHTLHTLALAALTATLLCVGAHAVPISLLSNSGFTDGVGGLDGWSTSVTPAGTSTCCSQSPNFVVEAPGTVTGPFDGTGPFNIDFDHGLTLSDSYSSAILAFVWNPQCNNGGTQARVFSVQLLNGAGAIAATLYSYAVPGGTSDNTDHTVSIDVAATLNTLPAGAYTFRFDSYIPEDYSGPATMRISALSLMAELNTAVLFATGDAVPGAGAGGIPENAKFTFFGVPAINASGTVAVLTHWRAGGQVGSGIFCGNTLVAKAGDVVSGTAAIRYMRDPAIDDAGHVLFTASLIGAGISEANNAAVISNAPLGTLAIVAQEGTQAADTTEGALWKSFESVAAPGAGGGVLILGNLTLGVGGVTVETDNCLWAADATGALRLVLREGVTTFGGKTVKRFAVLKAILSTQGQTRAFNDNSELVARVTFTDSKQAVLHLELP